VQEIWYQWDSLIPPLYFLSVYMMVGVSSCVCAALEDLNQDGEHKVGPSLED